MSRTYPLTIIRPDENDEWPYTPYKLNTFGLVDNPPSSTESTEIKNTKSILNLGRFLFFCANDDGQFENIEDAANEAQNIMCGEYYISNTDGDKIE